MPDENSKIIERIKSLRIAKGMSMEEVSKLSGIPEETLSSFENHLVSPPLGNIVSLAKVFEVSVGEIFGDIADSPFCIVRSDDRKTVSRFNSLEGTSYGYSYESLGYQEKKQANGAFPCHSYSS